jgi:hypothetical protein
MMRTFNFALVFLTAVICVGVYRVAEDARVAHAELVATERQIVREHQALRVLDAEWAAVTQPNRIAALAERHLDLNDAPPVQLSSLTLLPRRGEAPLTEGPIRDARAVVPQVAAPPIGAIRRVAWRRTGT